MCYNNKKNDNCNILQQNINLGENAVCYFTLF